jgi:hypothetical protein
MEELTQDQIEKSISAAYDSVSLINGLNSKEVLTEKEADSKDRNIEHIKIMLSKEWFANALTKDQKTELEVKIYS